MKRVKTAVPVGIEAAARRFAAACLRDGWTGSVVLTCGGGSVDYLTNSGATSTTYSLVEGDWYELGKVD